MELISLEWPEIRDDKVYVLQGNSSSPFEMPLWSESQYWLKGVPWPAVVSAHRGTVLGI